MFSIDPTLSYLDVDDGEVISLAESINQPHVAVPERGAQSALGYLIEVLGRDGRPSLYVYLWLSRSQEAVIYSLEDRDRLAADPAWGRERALEFCESMGFMMEELQLAGISEDAKRELLLGLAPFQREPELKKLERSPGLGVAPSGPSMNANYEVGAATDPSMEPLDVLELIEEEPTLSQAETEKLARLLVGF